MARETLGLFRGRVTHSLPPCRTCGTPTANFASLTCQKCKAAEAGEG